jgi:hypothetical protein
MTGYQLSVFFGTPAAVALLAWGLVGLHRLMPRPNMHVQSLVRDGVAVQSTRSTGLPRDLDPSFRPANVRKQRKVSAKPV